MTYPPIPSVVGTSTIKLGTTPTAELGAELYGPSLSDAPEFELGNLGEGQQLIRYRANRREWRFKAQRPFEVYTYAKDHSQSTAVPLTGWDGGTVDPSPPAGAFRITWETPAGDSFVLTGTPNAATGRLSFDVVVTLDAATQVTRSLHSFDAPILRVLPYADATKEGMKFLVADEAGVIEHDVCDVVKYGYRRTVSPSIGLAFADPNADWLRDIGSMQFLALYHYPTSSGLLISTHDETGSSIQTWRSGKGDHVHLGLRHVPPDNLAAGSHTLPYQVHIEPYVGRAYEASRLYQQRVREAQPSWFMRDTVEGGERLTRSQTANNAFGVADGTSAAANSKRYILWLAPHSAAVPNADDVWDRCTEEYDRCLEFFGKAPIVFLYGYHFASGIFAQNEQDHEIDITKARTLIAHIKATGGTVILYWDPHFFAKNSTWISGARPGVTGGYDPAYGNPLDYRVLDRSGTPKSMVITGQGSPTPDNDYWVINLGHPDARNHIAHLLNEKFFDGSESLFIDGVYLDALTGSTGPHSDYNPALDDADKGPGSGFYPRGRWALIKEMRDLFRSQAGHADATLSSEFVAEDSLGIDLLSYRSNFLPIGQAFEKQVWPAFQTVYGRWQGTFSFPSPITAQLGVIGKIGRDAKMLEIAQQFHAGAIPLLAWFGDLAQPHLIVKSGDPSGDIAIWDESQSAIMDFVKTLTSHGTAPRYTRGQRLMPPEGSQEDLAERDGYSAIAIDGVADVRADSYVASVWQTDEARGNPVGVIVTNHALEEREITVRADTSRYPEIGPGMRYLVENQAVPVLLATFESVLEYSTTIAPGDVRIFEVYSFDPTAD